MVSAEETADYKKLRQLCLSKQRSFNPHVVLSDNVEEHELLYKSMIQATLVPGCSSPFTLVAYKTAVGGSYSQITFVLNATTTGKDL